MDEMYLLSVIDNSLREVNRLVMEENFDKKSALFVISTAQKALGEMVKHREAEKEKERQRKASAANP